VLLLLLPEDRYVLAAPTGGVGQAAEPVSVFLGRGVQELPGKEIMAAMAILSPDLKVAGFQAEAEAGAEVLGRQDLLTLRQHLGVMEGQASPPQLLGHLWHTRVEEEEALVGKAHRHPLLFKGRVGLGVEETAVETRARPIGVVAVAGVLEAAAPVLLLSGGGFNNGSLCRIRRKRHSFTSNCRKQRNDFGCKRH
jgi:hypothetical protein